MLQGMLEKLPPSEKKIAMYVLKNPHETISLTASQLGKKSSTSGAAVIRLCKSLELKGFQDLKFRITGDLQKTKATEIRDINPNESVQTIIDKVTNNTIQTIRETIELLNTEELEKAVHVLKNTGVIHFYGVGASGIIALDAQQKFMRIDKKAIAFTDLHMATTLVANANKDDVVVGISFSGNTFEVAKLLELANKKGTHTISLTKYGSSLVTDQADIKLYTSGTMEPTFRSGATSSRIAQLHVIDILFMSVASQAYDDTVRHLDETREMINLLHDPIKQKQQK